MTNGAATSSAKNSSSVNSPSVNSPYRARFTEGSISKHLWEMAWPMVWGLIATMSFNAVDAYFVSKLGEASLAAMGFTFPVVMVVTSIAIGLGAGASSAIARAVGAGDHEKVNRLATDAISLSTLISIAVCLLGWLTIEPLFTLLGAEAELLPAISAYMSIWYLSAPFLLVPMVSLSALRALGFHRIQGVLMVIAAVMNVFLDPIFIFSGEELRALAADGTPWAKLFVVVESWSIFGVNGLLLHLGIEGAAWATLITRVLVLVVAGYVLIGRCRAIVNPLVHWRLIQSSWKSLFHVGLPAIVSNLIIPVASGIVVWLIADYGTAAVAGYSAAVRIEPLALIAFYALSGVVGPFAGQNKGAGNFARLFATVFAITRFCLIFGLCMALSLWLLGSYLGRYFVASEEALRVIQHYLVIVPISYGAYGLVMSVNAMFNGLGWPLPGLVISFLRVFGVYVPCALLGMWLWDLNGIFVATAVSNCIVGAVAYFWLVKMLRQHSAQKNDLGTAVNVG